MDKRIAKRHKRQVTRAKANVKISEPDVRTPEQIAAAREASQAGTSGHNTLGLTSSNAAASRGRATAPVHSASKSDA